MKKWNIVLIGLLLLSLTRISAQEYYMTKPVGYGKTATGGGNATPVTVTTYTELSNALTASGSGVILIKGAIQIDYLSVLVTNKTILGLPGSKLFTNDQTAGKSGILYFKPGTKNVIMRNVTFVGPGAYDTDGRDCLTFDGATDCWVDHCDFQDGMDGNFDNKGDTDNITVSWCKFSYNKPPKAGGSGGTDDHRFTDLVGSSSSDYPTNTSSDTQYSMTWQYCWWAEGCVERQVRARNAQLHILNCFWNSSVANKCIGLEDGSNGKGTQCYLEGGVFETPSKTKNIDPSYGGTPDVTVVDCTGNNLSNYSTAVSKPSYDYTALSSSLVKAALTSSCGAGATLNVTDAGVVSSSCNGTTPVAATLSLSSGSASQSVTVNNAISNIVYSFGGSATGVTVTGLPSGVSSSVDTSAKTVTISGTPTSVQSATYTVTTVGGSTTVSLNGTITSTAAIAAPTLSLVSGSASQSVTVNNAISNIVYSFGGGATGATVTGLPSGVSSSVNTSAKTVTISGTPTSVQSATYTVTTAGGSTTVSLNGTITSTAVAVTTLAVPTGITASATPTSATISWGAVTNATGYTVNVCSGGTTSSSDVVMLLNSTTAASTGVYTLNTGDQYKTSSSISTSSACSPAGYTNTYRSGSINDNSLKLVNTTGVTKLTIGAKSSGSTARNLSSYSINGGTAITSGITQSGSGACGEYIINGLSLTAGQEIAFVFDGNVQISYFIASAGTSSCTETAITGTSFTANGLTANTSYTYQVKATNSNTGYANSAYSTAATVTTTNTTVTNASLVLTSGSTNQSIILGNSIAAIVYTYGGSGTGATVTGLPSGVSYSVNTSAKTVTISGTPASAVTSAAYTVTTSQSSGNAATLSGTITAVAPITLAVPTNTTASATQTSATISWDAVANATGYTVDVCSGSTTLSNVAMLLNSTSATSTGVYTLNTGDQYKTSATISTSSACSPSGYTNTYRSGSINDNSLKLVKTTGVSTLVVGAKSSGSGARTLVGYSVNGGTQLTSGITQSGSATCGEYVINGLNLATGDEIAFVFDGNVQISYFIATVSTAGPVTCTETNVTGTSYTATGFSANTSVSYQVKATSTNAAYLNSAYSTAKSITTNNTTARYAANGSRITTTETDNTTTPEFVCYPTVVVNELQVSLPKTDNATITIFDLSGRQLISATAQGGNTTLNLSSLQQGVYVVLASQNGNLMQQRIIKK